jgi:peptide/nickel transport system ATP-binding protein
MPAADLPVVLEARDLSKQFRGQGPRGHAAARAVDGVSLSLRAGQAVALVGESGSGKSTVARLLAGIHPLDGGEILLDGRPFHRGRGAAARRRHAARVQLVFQDPFAALNPIHRIRYQLTRALRLHRRPGDPPVGIELEALLARVSLMPAERYLDRFPHQLSGGQLQRVSIARALAARPEVLLADEPVSMLDVSIRLGILRLLARLKDEERLALLYITHDIASARYFADEIVVMYRGQLVERGPSAEVTGRPAHPYTRLLIASAPDPARSEREPESAPAAVPPDGGRPETGCRFAHRCPHAMAVCVEREPDAIDLAPGHRARCWLHLPPP